MLHIHNSRVTKNQKSLRVAFIFICIFILGLVAFPILAQPSFRNSGVLLDGMGKPIPNTNATLAWYNERAEVTTNSEGGFEFPWPYRLREKVRVIGYEVTHVNHYTGAGRRYFYSHPGTLSVECVDTSGKRVDSKILVLCRDTMLESSSKGHASFANVPIAIREGSIRVAPKDLHLRLKHYARSTSGDHVTIRAVFRRQEKPLAEPTFMTYTSGRARLL
jgi:hypothetical protein